MILAKNMGMGDGFIFTIISVLIVFAVIGGIIFATYGISKLMDRSEEVPEKKEKPKQVINQPKNTNITDDDMMAAVLVATIDFRNEIKEDVRLVNVREIK